ncbi:MAG TPA: dihydrolipoamide acetyltransferase family protein [Terriglobia bacterium]|nr:dihydrolipoamide acetyltransferase family protein [Terriglobia bacterium]
MKVPVVMPQLGLTMTEGSVNTWLMKLGDTVHRGDMLFVVSTDKADMEIESLDEGVLSEITVELGNVVPVGTVIAYLSKPGDGHSAVSAPPVAVPEPQPVAPPEMAPTGHFVEGPPVLATEPATKKAKVRVSPRARRLARQLGVDLSKVAGSGRDGRIVERDVPRSQKVLVPSAPVASRGFGDLRRRQLIAEKLTQSIQTIPHFSVAAEVNAKELIALRDNLKGPIQQKSNLKLTMTDLLLKALGLALEETPGMKAVWEGGTPRIYSGCDLGLAIATDKGVVAPVIRAVDGLDLVEIGRRRSEATEKARAGRLSLTDLEGGIGTLSNLGMYRVDRFQALITPGQSFILAAGKIDNRPWVDKGALTVAPTLRLNLSVDHRVADGAIAAQFLGAIAELIENPYRLLWEPKKS